MKDERETSGSQWHLCGRFLPRDAHIAVALFTIAALFGAAYTVTWSGAPRGAYTFWIRPAIGLATGCGMVSPKDNTIPGIEEFLSKQKSSIDARTIPREYPTSPANEIQLTHMYLIHAVAAFWLLFGISWGALAPLYGIAFGLTAVFAYGLFRLGMNRIFALGCTALFMLSPGHLVVLPHMRDYAKVPFILASLLAMGVLLKYPLGWKRTLGLAALLGLAIGLGLGVRQDIQVLLLPAAAVLLCFLPGTLRRTWWLRIAATLLMFAVFTASAWPVLAAMRRGGSYPAHNIMGGLAINSNKSLGVGDAPYEWLYPFSDTYIATVISDYARYRLHAESPPEYLRPEYDKAGRTLIVDLIETFPADMILRGLAALRRIIEESPQFFGEPDFQPNGFVDDLSLRLGPAMFWAAKWSGILAIIVLAALSFSNFRIAMASVFLLLFLGLYPTLQFHFRHFFHLGFLTWWFPGVALNGVVMGLLALGRAETRRTVWDAVRAPAALWPRRIRPAIVFILLVASGILLPWYAAGLIQYRQVGKLLETVAAQPLVPLDCEMQEADAGGRKMLLFQPKRLFEHEFTDADKRWQARRAMVVVELRGNTAEVPVSFLYDAQFPKGRWDHDVTVRLPEPDAGSMTRYYFPVFELPQGARTGSSLVGWRKFKGVVLAESQLPHLVRIYKVEDPENIPLLMCYQLDERWRESSARRHSVVPRRLNGRMRIVAASWANELGNGGFEMWDTARNAPVAGQAPKAHSTIQIETEIVSRGQQAIRQEWTSNDTAESGLRLFGVWAQGLKPGAVYDLVIDANNPDNIPIRISVWRASGVAGQSPRVGVLTSRLIVVGKTEGYKTFIGTFSVPEDESHETWWLFSTSCLDPNTTNATVYWDSWRLGEAAEYY